MVSVPEASSRPLPISSVRLVIVAVPVQRFLAVLGALVLSTQGGEIDAIVSAKRWAIFRVFLVAAGVTVLLDDIERQIAEDKALGGPPQGSA